MLIDGARQALRSSTTISTALKASKTKIDHALGHVGALVHDVEMALASIESEVAVMSRPMQAAPHDLSQYEGDRSIHSSLANEATRKSDSISHDDLLT